jgi:hypothetical protein
MHRTCSILALVAILGLVFVVGANPAAAGSKVNWAGVRSSPYGISPFPGPAGWEKAIDTMAGYFPGSTRVAVWLVGEIYFDGPNSGMEVGFPNPGGIYDPRIRFSATDKYERYLKYFDTHGIKVFLQFEPGFAKVNDLIAATYKRYGHHPCVVGFGVDVEWFRSRCDGCANGKVIDAAAKAWETKVRSLNPNYRLFLKHFDKTNLPPTYRGRIIFINDSMGFANEEEMLSEFEDFADFFYPSAVMFQVGYEEDEKWWSKLPTPIPQTLGEDLAARMSQRNSGIIWVDFTLRDVLPTR